MNRLLGGGEEAGVRTIVSTDLVLWATRTCLIFGRHDPELLNTVTNLPLWRMYVSLHSTHQPKSPHFGRASLMEWLHLPTGYAGRGRLPAMDIDVANPCGHLGGTEGL